MRIKTAVIRILSRKHPDRREMTLTYFLQHDPQASAHHVLLFNSGLMIEFRALSVDAVICKEQPALGFWGTLLADTFELCVIGIYFNTP